MEIIDHTRLYELSDHCLRQGGLNLRTYIQELVTSYLKYDQTEPSIEFPSTMVTLCRTHLNTMLYIAKLYVVHTLILCYTAVISVRRFKSAVTN